MSESIDFDASGLVTVSGSDKSTGKTNKITITNNKACVLQYDIERRMVKKAELFQEEDERQRTKVDAKTSLEKYAYCINKPNMREGKVADKIDAPDVRNRRDQVMVPKGVECREALVLALLPSFSGPSSHALAHAPCLLPSLIAPSLPVSLHAPSFVSPWLPVVSHVHAPSFVSPWLPVASHVHNHRG